MDNQKKVWAVIPAAGSGSRMGTSIHKQFIQLRGKEILVRTLEVFETMPEVEGIVVVTSREDMAAVEELVQRYNLVKVRQIVQGGSVRQQSVYYGLKAVPEECDIVLIHDAARPFVRREEILETMDAAEAWGGALLAVPVKDTIKVASPGGIVTDTPVRSTLYAAQTPQTFRLADILAAHEKAAAAEDLSCTDDCQIMEKYGEGRVKIVRGSYSNMKITTPEDLSAAEALLQEIDE